MRFGKFWLSPMVIVLRFYQLLSLVWFIPFGFYQGPIKKTGVVPHPLKPRNLRDLILNKMMFPDNPLRAVVSDKLAARGWAAEQIGCKYLVPLYGVYDTIADLAQAEHSYPYVVKTNHASAQYCFVNNDVDRAAMLKKVKKWNLGEHHPKTEWAYRGIKTKFMVEKMLVDQEQTTIIDIKLYAFFGETRLIHYITDRENGSSRTFFNENWEHLDITYENDATKMDLPKPAYFDELLRLGATLGAEFDFARIDFLICSGKIYFGELTNFSTAGSSMFQPPSFDTYLFEEYTRIRNDRIQKSREKYSAQGFENR